MELDHLIKMVDEQVGNQRRDTSFSKIWSATNGNSLDTVFTEFKINSSSKELVRAIVFNKGRDCISFYYRSGQLFGVKINFSKEFSGWNGKSISINHAESNDILVSTAGDESESNVSKSLTLSGYAWLRYFEKWRKSNSF